MSNESLGSLIGRDTESIRTSLITRISNKCSLTRFTASDPGTALLDAVAEVADMLGYFIDKSRLEMNIGTCTQKDSLLAHAKDATYYVRGINPPSVEVLVTSDSITASFDRKQILLDDASYVIVSPVDLASRNDYTYKVTAYNGTLESLWVSKSQIDMNDPLVVVGKASNVVSNGVEVYFILSTGGVEKLRKREWYLAREGDDAVVVLRSNKLTSPLVAQVLVKYVLSDIGSFKPVSSGKSYTVEGLTFTTTEESTSGSGEELFERSRRGIIAENRIVNAVVSLADYESIAMNDPDVDKAKAFDYNTPSVIEVPDSVVTYIKMNSDAETLPSSVISRLDEELSSRSTVVGVSHEWRIAPQVKFDIVADVYAYSTDDVDASKVRSSVIEHFDNLEFYQMVTSGMIESFIRSLSPFIARVVLNNFTNVDPTKIQIPVLNSVTIRVLRHEDFKSGY